MLLNPLRSILVSLVCFGGADASAALLWTNQTGFRAALVTPNEGGKTGFTSILPGTTGIRFSNLLPATRHYTNQILLNGSGVTAGDLDGDGWCDLVFGGLGGRTAMYRNLGDWRFEDITSHCGVDLSKLDVTGVLAADLDGDNDLDLILNTVGQGTWILENDGGGRLGSFRSNPVINAGHCGTSSALADVDGDGDLDLYIANYRVNTMRDEPHLGFTIREVQGRPRVTAYGDRSITNPDLVDRFKFHYQPAPGGGGTVLHEEQGEPDAFYRNEGGGRFAPVPFTNGIFLDQTGTPLTAPPFDWGLSVVFRDLNRDRAPDIYVCNDFSSPDRIWINDGAGHFRPLPDFGIRQTSLSTMAVDLADINGDGFDDIFTADMLSPERWRRLVQISRPNPNMHLFTDVATRPQSPRNMLQLNRGDGTYAEMAQMSGLEASDWSWASAFLDVDLDGYEDLLVANGFERDFMNMDAHRRVQAMQARVPRGQPPATKLAANRFYPRLPTPNLAFRNSGNLKFVEMGKEWGFDLAAVSQGMCFADLDNDGDLDVVLNNLNGPVTLLRNDSVAPRLAVRLRGNPPNTRGIGARVIVTGGAVARQSREMLAGGRYLSGDDANCVFAAGSPTNRLACEVIWRNGARTVLTNMPANHIYEIAEAGARPPAARNPISQPAPLFRDASGSLQHFHRHIPGDEAAWQPMLPIRLDSLGPGASWLDLDADGWEDLVLPGGTMAIYYNDGRGGFVRKENSAAQPLEQSQTSIVGWRGSEGAAILLSGFASEPADGPTNRSPARQYHVDSPRSANVRTTISFPELQGSTGPLALADIDRDGDLDVFVGGRFVPGRWPEPASSALFRQDDGKWTKDAANSDVFNKVGLVSGALFTDLDGDGDPDLVLACEWGPIQIFANELGRFTPSAWRLAFGQEAPLDGTISDLSQLTGWWNGVNSGDFDGDGRLDLIASNWGRNTKYERFRSRPLRVYFGDFTGDQSVSIVESWFDPVLQKYTPVHDVWTLSRTLPWLLARFNSYEAFARAGIEEALGQHFQAADHKQAAWLESAVFLNRGDHFQVRALPWEAQLAPAFATCVADFDNDGNEDLFLSQNFFAVRLDTSRYDAGRGLLLLGDGRGDFRPLSGQESGLTIHGEQRGAAVCDYDNDGRVDLAVAQFNGETRLFRNETARPGLRVRLEGARRNPQAIGATLRLKVGGQRGPVRELHAGSGYWSQDSSIQVLSRPGTAGELLVRWPSGETVEIPVAKNAAEVVVTENGR